MSFPTSRWGSPRKMIPNCDLHECGARGKTQHTRISSTSRSQYGQQTIIIIIRTPPRGVEQLRSKSMPDEASPVRTHSLPNEPLSDCLASLCRQLASQNAKKPTRFSPCGLLHVHLQRRDLEFSSRLLGRPGNDLLSRVLRRSTIGAGAFHGRVRDGIGWGTDAMVTKLWDRRMKYLEILGRYLAERYRNHIQPKGCR